MPVILMLSVGSRDSSFGAREGRPSVLLAEDSSPHPGFIRDFSSVRSAPLHFRNCFDETVAINHADAVVHLLHTKPRTCHNVVVPLSTIRSSGDNNGSSDSSGDGVGIKAAAGLSLDPLPPAVNRSSLFVHLNATLHNNTALRVCAETSAAVIDLACYRTVVTANIPLTLSNGTLLQVGSLRSERALQVSGTLTFVLSAVTP
jgi:hypothetical protein